MSVNSHRLQSLSSRELKRLGTNLVLAYKRKICTVALSGLENTLHSFKEKMSNTREFLEHISTQLQSNRENLRNAILRLELLQRPLKARPCIQSK